MKDVKVEVPEGYEAVWDEDETTVRIVEKKEVKLNAGNFYLDGTEFGSICLRSASGKGLLTIGSDGYVDIHKYSLTVTGKADGFVTDKQELELRT